MSIDIRPFLHDEAEDWDAFCAGSYQATLLHTRRFLSYHGDRFLDRSLVLEAGQRWLGLLPAAQHPADPKCIVSHPGVTYGGIVHQGGLVGGKMVEALSAICRHYAEVGYEKLIYKAIPSFYHLTPAQDDIYALYRLGAPRIRCDLSSTIDLERRRPVSDRRKRSLKRANKAGVEIQTGIEFVPELWRVLTDNLMQKHQTSPVHSLAEITLLAERFPDAIRCIVGTLDGRVEAGVLLFCMPGIVHAQYIASSITGYDVSALDAIFDYCIAEAKNAGKRWFNFGISTEDGGMVLNEGLYSFKTEFGGGGTLHEFFEIDLQRISNAS